MAKLVCTQGGCWFCGEDEEKESLLFSWEWDTNVHISCLRNALKSEDPNFVGEAELMAQESHLAEALREERNG